MPPKKKPTPPRVTERKLGREKVWGLWWSTGKIELDPRTTEKRRLKILIHEMLHHQFPLMPEAEVKRHADMISRVLWKEGYRRTG